MTFEDRRCVISRTGEVFATATDSHGLFTLDVTHEALSVVDRGKPECIHRGITALGIVTQMRSDCLIRMQEQETFISNHVMCN